MIHKHPEGLSCGCAYAERLETKVVALADEVERLREALASACDWLKRLQEEYDPTDTEDGVADIERLRAALNSSTEETR